MDFADVLRHLVDHAHFGSADNRAEAHKALDEQFGPKPAPAEEPGKEGTPE